MMRMMATNITTNIKRSARGDFSVCERVLYLRVHDFAVTEHRIIVHFTCIVVSDDSGGGAEAEASRTADT